MSDKIREFLRDADDAMGNGATYHLPTVLRMIRAVWAKILTPVNCIPLSQKRWRPTMNEDRVNRVAEAITVGSDPFPSTYHTR